jgi:hypothetical protein
MILGQALLEHGAELAQKPWYFAGLVLGELRQQARAHGASGTPHGLHLACRSAASSRDTLSGRSARIEHAFDEAQIQRQELLGVVHDETRGRTYSLSRERLRAATGRRAPTSGCKRRLV